MLTSISVSGGTTVVVGSALALVASPKDQNGSAITATVAWTSNAPTIASVNASSGVVTGVAVGTAVIAATSGSVSGTVNVTVTAGGFPLSVDITLGGNSFSPSSTDIARGGTVRWLFTSITHNVTFGPVSGAPADIPSTANQNVERTFTVAGVFTYQCTIHSGMTGQVAVH